MEHVQKEIPTWEKKLMDGQFRSINSIKSNALEFPGFYCIRLSPGHLLPEKYQAYLKANRLLYIGKADTLKRRLEQELFAEGHGTFFRSIGAVCGYRPPKGSLANKKNQNNYTFSRTDENKIIEWLKNSVEINWVEYTGNFSDEEPRLIRTYKPLLNIQHNPSPLKELIEDRDECSEIARTT
jgi:hypothetical protein